MLWSSGSVVQEKQLSFLDGLILENEGITVLQIIRNHSSTDTASHSRTPESCQNITKLNILVFSI